MTRRTAARPAPVADGPPPPRRARRTRRPGGRLAALAVVLVLGTAGAAVAVRAADPRAGAGGRPAEDLPAEPNGAVPRTPTGTAGTAGTPGLAGLTAGTRHAYLA